MGTQGTASTRLYGPRLIIARAVWIALVILSLGLFTLSIHKGFVQELSVLPLAVQYGLAQRGVSVNFFPVLIVAFDIATMLVFTATAAVIFWGRSDDSMTIFVSLMLITFGTSIIAPLHTLVRLNPAWGLPVLLVRALGWGSFLIVFYLFPDGRFVPRWTRVLAALWALWALASLLFPTLLPFHPFESDMPSSLLPFLVFLVSFGTGVCAQIYRFVLMSSPLQRRQTKWVVFGFTAAFLGFVVLQLVLILASFSEPGILRLLLGLFGVPAYVFSLLLVPLSIAASILLYQLWDIQLIINRTLVYGPVMGILALIYLGSAYLLQRVFQFLIGKRSDLAVVASTLAIVALSQPLRQRVQDAIDRRFYRRRYDAAQTLTAFATKVRDEVDLDRLTEALLSAMQNAMQPAHVSLWLPNTHNGPVKIAPDDPIIGHSQTDPGTIELDEVDLDSPALRALKADGMKLAVPLVNYGELLGLINLGPRLGGQQYSIDDRRLLDNLVTQAAPAVRVAQLVRQQQEEDRARERIEHELRLARQIQQRFLPDTVPTLPGWHLAAYYRPARAVSGDFYDFIPLPDGRLSIIIGDVADKGMPAALVMASSHSYLHAATQHLTSPSQALEEVNELLCPEMPPNMFVTCLYAVLDLASGQLQFANAGHTMPYLRTNSHVAELEATGVPLGLVPGMRYEEKEITLASGESVLFYSDGLVEAHSGQREMFGFPRLEALVVEHPDGASLIDFLLAELTAFTGPGWEQEDDVTLVTLERTAS